MEKAHDIHATIYDKTLAYYFKEEFKKSELVSPIMNDLIRHGNTITVEQYHQALEEQTEPAHNMDDKFGEYLLSTGLIPEGPSPLQQITQKHMQRQGS